MARRRRSRRRRSESFLTIGDSGMLGRELSLASWRLAQLPRAIAVAPSRSIQVDRLPVRPRLRPGRFSRKLSETELRFRAVRERRASRRVLLRPELGERTSVCTRRSKRREVLHAVGVAGVSGSRWREMMRRSRRSADSSFTCRR